MKIAIVGSRSITVNNLGDYLPENTTEIVSGGAIGVDRSARNYAKTHNIKLKEFLPEYERYGRSAPLKRNLQIIDYADEVIAFWDGMSHGTRFVIENCKRKNVPIKVYALANKKFCKQTENFIYKKRSGNINLRFAKQLPDRNFLFYILNFQFVKLSLFCE